MPESVVERIRDREPIGPDPRSITKFEPYVPLTITERELLLTAAAATKKADRLASEAHDAIYAEPFNQAVASDAIWRIHNLLRPVRVALYDTPYALYDTPAAATAANSEEEA